MSKVLSDGQYWGRLGLAYTIKVGYWLGRALIGDTKETLGSKTLGDIIRGNVTTWRTDAVSKRIVNGLLSVNLADGLSYAVHKQHLESLKKTREAQLETYKQLIQSGVTNKEDTYGYIVLDDSDNKKVWALDAGGSVVRESLILYYKDDNGKKQSVNIPKVTDDSNPVLSRDKQGNAESEPVTTAYVFFYDLSPEITMESSKNIILTPVQGRDYSRKELIAGGDMTFSIRGVVVSHNMYAYPKEDVARLLNIYQYGGIVEVSNILLGNYGVTRLLIKSLRFDRQDCKNIQPYTMQCVAVEPSESQALYDADLNVITKSNIQGYEDEGLGFVSQLQQLSGVNISLADMMGGVL